MKLRCLIIDDEPVAREGIAAYVEKVSYLELVQTLPHALDAHLLIEELNIDLLWLDIEMPDMTGIELLKTLPKPPMVILTTAHREYALAGFELNVIDYLLKPISFDRFAQASAKAYQKAQLTANSSKPSTSLNYFFIKVDGQYVKINYKDIRYIESAKDYVFIYTDKSRYLTLLSLKQLDEQLPNDQFIRVHRSYIIAIRYIEAIEGNQILLGDQKIPISRQLKDHVYDQLITKRLWKRT